MQTTLAILVLALVGLASAAPFRDCGSVKGEVKEVNISGCADSASVCMLKKGTNVEIDVSFIPAEDLDKLTLNVSAIVFGEELKLLELDACEGLGLQCPLKANVEYSAHTTIAIEQSYPALKLTVKGRLIDESGLYVGCILIPAEIVR